MHAQPPRTLKRLLKQYGQELIDDPRRTEALLRDHCGQHTREIFVLVNAQKQRIPSDLLAAPTWMPRQATYTRLSKQLQTRLALTEDAADWAVVSWAAALELDSPPKGDPWSWLPGQSRTPASSTSRKTRSKKRQNPASSVQSSKKSVSKAKARAARAELGWGFPLASLSWPIRPNVAWAHLLPWAALVGATVFLLAVVYWTSTTRDATIASNGNAGTTDETPAAQNIIGAQNATVAPIAPTPVALNGTPLPELSDAPREYMQRVMPLPTWANVSEGPLLIRQEPSTDSPFLSILQDGDPISVVTFSEDGRWSQIDSPQAGWVSNDFLLFISKDATHSSVRLTVQQLRARYDANVLSAPLADADEVATLRRDDFVIVAATLGQPVTWYQIVDPAIGWVAASDLVVVAP